MTGLPPLALQITHHAAPAAASPDASKSKVAAVVEKKGKARDKELVGSIPKVYTIYIFLFLGLRLSSRTYAIVFVCVIRRRCHVKKVLSRSVDFKEAFFGPVR